MIEEILDIKTTDGAMETFVCRPERGDPHPAVFKLMDAPGIREELYEMARRLATVGYCVLLPNLYYRAGRHSKFGSDVNLEGSAEHQRMRKIRVTMTIPQAMKDIGAMLAFVDGGAIFEPRGRGRLVLRNLAGERCRGKPTPYAWPDQG